MAAVTEKRAFTAFLTPVGFAMRQGANRKDYPWHQYIARPAKGESLDDMRNFEFWGIPQPALWVDVYPVDGTFPPTRLEFIAGELVGEEAAPVIDSGLTIPGGVTLPVASIGAVAPKSRSAVAGRDA